MFDNIGGKIKSLAQIMAYILMGLSILAGLLMLFSNPVVGLLSIVVGCLSAWIGSFFMYAFGELVENSERSANSLNEIRSMLYRMNNPAPANNSYNPNRPNNGQQNPTATAAGQAAAYQNIPAWQRVEMEQAQKEKEQQQQ